MATSTTHIELTEKQAAELQSLLEQTVSDLGMEIASTDRLEFRDELKGRRQRLREVLEAIRQQHKAPV